MSGQPPAPVAALTPGPRTAATVEALRETLATLRAGRAGPAKAAAPAGLQGLVPAPPARPQPAGAGEFVRELARRESAPKPAKAAAPPTPALADTIPPDILPLLFEQSAFAPVRPGALPEPGPVPPGRPARPAGIEPAEPARPAASPEPVDLGRFRADAGVPQPATTASSPAPAAPERPAGRAEIDVERLSRVPNNFVPLEVLQEMKARHRGASLRPEAPEPAAPPVTSRAR